MDISHRYLDYKVPEIEHYYGDTVHILSDPHIRTLLARLCNWSTEQPEINRLVNEIYRGMLAIALGSEFPRKTTEFKTRMYPYTQNGFFSGEVIASETTAVTVAMARAGIIPSGICFDQLLHFLEPSRVRQDYFHIGRVTNEKDEVTGAHIASCKIGGSIDKAMVVIPDPMGATASSVCEVVAYYNCKVEGTPLKIVTVHMIITPEYIRRMLEECPEVIIYAARLDRGESDKDTLVTVPGTHIDKEFGLTKEGYVVPGAGGLGEIMNNSFV
jgi:uracil phosphoribosyltransferase